MMHADSYISIKEDVLTKLETHFSEMQERFGVEELGVFGSVSRRGDTPDSDIDILYTFKKGQATLANLIGLNEYLETLLRRNVDLVGRDWVSPYIRSEIMAEIIIIGNIQNCKKG